MQFVMLMEREDRQALARAAKSEGQSSSEFVRHAIHDRITSLKGTKQTASERSTTQKREEANNSHELPTKQKESPG